MLKVIVIGASGFIGKHLLTALTARSDIAVRVLVHRTKLRRLSGVEYVEGNLLSPASLQGIFEQDSTVINLAFLPERNQEAMINLAQACANSKVARLIHCSTAVVDGRSDIDKVDESTQCLPQTAYEKDKLEIESLLLEAARGKFELTILRPTAVFGPGGKNVLKLVQQLLHESLWRCYLRSCIFGRRSMNLVSVENVVGALLFLMQTEKVDREIFIITDDEEPANNYCDIETVLMVRLGKKYPLPRIRAPQLMLQGLLALAGKPNVNPSKKYSSLKLAERGFRKSRDLAPALVDFADWVKRQPGQNPGRD